MRNGQADPAGPAPGAARHVFNLSWLIGADLFGKALSFVYFGYLTLKLSLQENGWYGAYIAFFPILMVLTSLGFPEVITREVARRNDRVHRLASSALVLAVATGLSVVLAAEVLALALSYTPELRTVLRLSAVTAAIWGFINIHTAVLAAHERFQAISVVNIIVRTVTITASMALLYAGFGVFPILYLLIPMYLGQLGLCWWTVQRMGSGYHFEPAWQQARMLLREGWAMAMGRLAGTSFYRMDVPLLNPPLGTPPAADYYALGTRLFAVLTTLPDTLESIFLPILSRRAPDASTQGSRPGISRGAHAPVQFAVERFLKYMLLAGLPIGVGLTFTGERLVLWFGSEWAPSVGPVILLSWVLVFLMADRAIVVFLRAVARQDRILWCYGAAFLMKFGASLAVIPRHGAAGLLAINLVLSAAMTLVFLAMSRAALPELSWRRLANAAARPAAAAAGLALGLWFIEGWPLLVLIPSGVALYLALCLLTNALDAYDRQLILSMLPRSRRPA